MMTTIFTVAMKPDEFHPVVYHHFAVAIDLIHLIEILVGMLFFSFLKKEFKGQICFFKMSLGKKHNFFYSSLLVRTFIFFVVNRKIDFQDEMSGLFE
jgi:hypothetical protein